MIGQERVLGLLDVGTDRYEGAWQPGHIITTTVNLNGFTDTIKSVFPESKTQICVVRPIRNASRYVVWKDKKTFTAHMKGIYNSPNEKAARAALENFAKKWESKYSYAIKSWR